LVFGRVDAEKSTHGYVHALNDVVAITKAIVARIQGLHVACVVDCARLDRV
jgi:hypothetical protein